MILEQRLLAVNGDGKRSSSRGNNQVTHVLLHFMSNVAQNPHDPFNIEQIRNIFVDYKLSAHYIIARDGVVVKLVEEDRIAWHAGKGSLSDFPDYSNRLNNHSIGIEFLAIGSRDEMVPKYISGSAYDALPRSSRGFTEEQYSAANELLTDIFERHPNIVKDRRHIIGHDEYAGYQQRPDNPKVDPGTLFDWNRIIL